MTIKKKVPRSTQDKEKSSAYSLIVISLSGAKLTINCNKQDFYGKMCRI